MRKLFTFLFFLISFLPLSAQLKVDEAPNPIPDELSVFGPATSNFLTSQSSENYFRVNDLTGSASKGDVRTALSAKNISLFVWEDYRSGEQSIYGQLVAADGSNLGENFKISQGPNDFTYTRDPFVTCNANDQFLVVWTDSRSGTYTYGQLIKDDGTFVGENFNFNDEGNYAAQFYPSATSNGSEYLVIWSDTRFGYNYDVFGQLVDSAGALIDSNFVINDSLQEGRKFYPRGALDKDLNIAAVWYELVDGKYISRYAQRNDNYELVRKEHSLADDSTVIRSYTPDVAYCDTGFVAVWYDGRSNNYTAFGQFYDRSGNAVDSNFAVGTSTNYAQYYPTLANLGNSKFLISWREVVGLNTFVKARVYSGMAAVDSGFVISGEDDLGLKYYPQSRGNANGAFSNVWLEVPRNGKYEYNVYGNVFSGPENILWESRMINDDVNSGSQTYSDIAVFEDGSYVVSWTGRDKNLSSVFFQRFDNAGTPIDSNQVVPRTSTKLNPEIAAGPNKTFMISWREYSFGNYNIHGVLYNWDGDTLKAPFLISNNERTGHRYFNNLTSDGEKFFLSSWSQYTNGAYRIYSQLMDADANLVGENIAISTDSLSNNYYPDAVVDTSGAFAVVWYTNGGGVYRALMQRVGSDGQAIDTNRVAYTDYDVSYRQYNPAIALNKAGDAVIVTREGRPSYNVYYQKYKNFLSKDNFVAVDSSMALQPDVALYASYPEVALDEAGNFVVAWFGYNGQELNNVYMMPVFSDTSKHSSPILVQSETYGQQQYINISLKNGNAYTTWYSNHELGYGYNIYASVMAIDGLVSAIDDDAVNPDAFKLYANYPNPFNPVTRIKYNLKSASKVTLKLYDVAGRLIRTLVNKKQLAGTHHYDLNAGNLASGLYFYTLHTANGFTQTRKMVLLK